MSPARLALALAAFAVGLIAFAFVSEGPKESLEVGDAAPPFTLPDTAGVMRSSGEWAGEVVVLNFWATWCPPCRREVPALVATQEAYGARGLRIVGVALDEPAAVDAFAREMGIGYPLLVGQQEVVELARRFGNLYAALPFTVVLDREGRIVHAQAGEVTRDALALRVEGLL